MLLSSSTGRSTTGYRSTTPYTSHSENSTSRPDDRRKVHNLFPECSRMFSESTARSFHNFAAALQCWQSRLTTQTRLSPGKQRRDAAMFRCSSEDSRLTSVCWCASCCSGKPTSSVSGLCALSFRSISFCTSIRLDSVPASHCLVLNGVRPQLSPPVSSTLHGSVEWHWVGSIRQPLKRVQSGIGLEGSGHNQKQLNKVQIPFKVITF